MLHGLRVFGGNGSLPGICREQRVEAVYLSSGRIHEGRVREILEDCRAAGVEVKRMRIVFEPVGGSRVTE
jgi:hypothetical protein